MPSNLKQPCLNPTPLEGKTGKDLSRALIDSVSKGNLCAIKHDKTVEFYEMVRKEANNRKKELTNHSGFN